jgi:hypothetical protein
VSKEGRKAMRRGKMRGKSGGESCSVPSHDGSFSFDGQTCRNRLGPLELERHAALPLVVPHAHGLRSAGCIRIQDMEREGRGVDGGRQVFTGVGCASNPSLVPASWGGGGRKVCIGVLCYWSPLPLVEQVQGVGSPAW